jgi:4-alpha-glucanotransferase
MSPSRLCIIPLQDVLGLPTEHRMNTPGSESGNWRWRMLPEHLSGKYFSSITEFTEVYGREADSDFAL